MDDLIDIRRRNYEKFLQIDKDFIKKQEEYLESTDTEKKDEKKDTHKEEIPLLDRRKIKAEELLQEERRKKALLEVEFYRIQAEKLEVIENEKRELEELKMKKKLEKERLKKEMDDKAEAMRKEKSMLWRQNPTAIVRSAIVRSASSPAAKQEIKSTNAPPQKSLLNILPVQSPSSNPTSFRCSWCLVDVGIQNELVCGHFLCDQCEQSAMFCPMCDNVDKY